VTGIAGPSGATPGKPVGLTYVAVADAAGVEIRRFAWHGDREANKAASAQAALELLLAHASAIAAAAATTSGEEHETEPEDRAGAG
jgi:nicotinamide mononucleotide (NMN) deamidase PncC